MCINWDKGSILCKESSKFECEVIKKLPAKHGHYEIHKHKLTTPMGDFNITEKLEIYLFAMGSRGLAATIVGGGPVENLFGVHCWPIDTDYNIYNEQSAIDWAIEKTEAYCIDPTNHAHPSMKNMGAYTKAFNGKTIFYRGYQG